jgi:hypothetical protein
VELFGILFDIVHRTTKAMPFDSLPITQASNGVTFFHNFPSIPKEGYDIGELLFDRLPRQ